MSNLRTRDLLQWLESHFSAENISLIPLTGDAGFRRYFRFHNHNQSQSQCYIAVDAPVKLSNNQAFVDVQQILQELGVNVPNIIAADLEAGFLCLSDFGDTVLAERLSSENMQHYYAKAIIELSKMLKCKKAVVAKLPDYNAPFILTELAIFKEWLLEKHLGIYLTADEEIALSACFDVLVSAIIAQPKIFMHRDYHSRNIMLLADDKLGVIDFQDAVKGPVIYDLVSLLKDCYVRWPKQLITPLMEDYRQQVQNYFPDENLSKEKWQYWFDLTGLQRHIKASGIFSRLHHRDNKSGYLADIPLTLTYIQDVSAQYDKLSFLHELVTKRVIPAVNKRSGF
ncbi:phosphotransferase [Colwellia sp. MB02u-18]|uniref:aminoglycoside phosphotransferase family protein n=1 Tax=unclassified Colwellia TaxID=196834 RepID=UPI0015F46FEA|nr:MULTISPECIES: phosphotransferase [unclassified Colwellia]MBA6222866.1 phosphotransferase [Colwellia sp. MB3u-45]MBA6266156.1 phosphotransferase [Colwellia sp. MB3u-43]MBA6319742.1 phosphotransferase [Colwellia sp. MB02u-19]MBA6324945.1 phosphotransferase [Colwellia sp. MB02u-18]MBA6329733.1 phosphotransferase [Colwellia sp. MB02u-12]